MEGKPYILAMASDVYQRKKVVRKNLTLQSGAPDVSLSG